METATTDAATTNAAKTDAATPDVTGDDLLVVKVTEFAAEKVREIRDAENMDDDMALRVRVVGGGCSGFGYDLYFDKPQDGDRAVESLGVKMVVDQMSMMYLMGTTVDYVEGLHGAGFKFNNPNVTSTCGCGSSFSV